MRKQRERERENDGRERDRGGGTDERAGQRMGEVAHSVPSPPPVSVMRLPSDRGHQMWGLRRSLLPEHLILSEADLLLLQPALPGTGGKDEKRTAHPGLRSQGGRMSRLFLRPALISPSQVQFEGLRTPLVPSLRSETWG